MSYDEVISTIQWGYDLAVKNGPMCLEEMMVKLMFLISIYI